MEITPFDILVQAFGVIGIISSVLSFQFKSHKLTMIFRTLTEIFFGIQYILLGAYTGAAMNFFGSIRNMTFAKMVEKNKNTIPIRIVFSVIFAVFIAFTWAGPKSLLSGIAKIVSTFIYGNSNTRIIRIGIFFTCVSWMIYNIYVGSAAGVVCEALSIISIIIGMIRIDGKKEKAISN